MTARTAAEPPVTRDLRAGHGGGVLDVSTLLLHDDTSRPPGLGTSADTRDEEKPSR